MTTFSAYFKETRKKLQLSQEQVAEKLRVSKRSVSSWETGESEPRLKQRREIEELFNQIEEERIQNGKPAPGDRMNPMRAFMLAIAHNYATWRVDQEMPEASQEKKKEAVKKIKDEIGDTAILILGGLDEWPFQE